MAPALKRFTRKWHEMGGARITYAAYKCEEIVHTTFWKLVYSPLFLAKCRLYSISIGRGFRIRGRVVLNKFPRSSIDIGEGFSCISDPFLSIAAYSGTSRIRTVMPSAQIRIGNGVGVNGVNITCRSTLIAIGDQTMIAAGTAIIDSDFHGIGESERRLPRFDQDRPVLIGSRVWIGMNCTILKGTEIGDGTVIGAGSIVKGRLDAHCIYAGNPARKVRNLVESDPS